MDDKLDKLFELQRKFGENFTDFSILQMPEQYKTKQHSVLEFIDHLIEELIELRRELPIRKHWSSKQANIPNWENAKEELVDALHFFITIALLLDLDSNELFRLYLNKNQINIKRQKENY